MSKKYFTIAILLVLPAIIGCERNYIVLKPGETKTVELSYLMPTIVKQKREVIEKYKFSQLEDLEKWSESDQKLLRISVAAPDFIQVKVLETEVSVMGDDLIVGFKVKPQKLKMSASLNSASGDYVVAIHYSHSKFEDLQKPKHGRFLRMLSVLGYIDFSPEDWEEVYKSMRITCTIHVKIR